MKILILLVVILILMWLYSMLSANGKDDDMSKAETCVCCGRVIPENSQYCIICGEAPKRKKQRQIDRIGNMSVEEMADVIKCPAAYDLKFDKIANCRINSYQCKKCCQKYLESEVQG